jgi:iron complex transport system substrate-binding protein
VLVPGISVVGDPVGSRHSAGSRPTSTGAALPATAARTVVDDTGRRVEIPDRIARVFAAEPPASILLCTVAPQTMVDWTRPLSADGRALSPPSYGSLPTLGRLTGRGNTANVEAVLAARRDLILP